MLVAESPGQYLRHRIGTSDLVLQILFLLIYSDVPVKTNRWSVVPLCKAGTDPAALICVLRN